MGFKTQNEYQEAKSSLNNQNVQFIQALYELSQSSKKKDFDPDKITKLELSDIESIEKALQMKYDFLTVESTEDGVALMPSGSHGGSSETVEVGSQLKYGQVITTVGDLSGFSLHILVSEVDIGMIKVGQRAQVSGAAFPGIFLNAEVTKVDKQASTEMGSGGGLPSFNVHLDVKHVTDEQREVIKVGMSAKIQLLIEKKSAIEVPIAAVMQDDDGKTVVVKKTQKGFETIEVVTGQTKQKTVEIKYGLKAGDVLVLPHWTQRGL